MKITEVMQQLRDEVTRRQGSAASAHNGAAANVESAWSLPAPPTMHVTPLREGVVERFSELERRALQKTEVNRRVPKFLRRLFRKQGGFNKEILAVAKFLMKEDREAKKRLREITAYLEAEHGWLHAVMNTISQVNAGLQARLENQQSFERRLLDLNDRFVQVKADSLHRERELSESLQRISSELANERNAREKLQADWEANVTTTAKTKTRFDEQIDAVHRKLNSLSDILAAAREALIGEAKVREGLEQVANGQHQRLDAFSTTLQTLQHALAAEIHARESLTVHRDRDAPLLASLHDAVRVVRTESAATRDNLQAAEAALASIQQTLTSLEARQFDEASFLKRELYLHSQRFVALQESVRPAKGRKPSHPPPSTPAGIDQHQFDGFYLAFENQFRGSRADIKDRVRVYLPLLRKAGLAKKSSGPVLDLGCGRGEWLELLRDEGFTGRGVDLNLFMVEECLARKLDVAQAEVIEHLGRLPSDSHGAVTAFHLIEHLPFPVLVKLFAESLRVLRSGGICIFETPNPDNLQVGSNRFYFDPTHLRPLPHDFIKFVMSTAGFKRLQVLPLHPDIHAVSITEEAGPLERFAHQMFFGAQDYAVIGRK